MQSSPKARLSLMAMKLGVPLPVLLSAIRSAFGVNCAYCEFYNRILVKRHKLGEAKTLDLLSQIIVAKKNNDIVLLERLKKEFD
jgi:hypothetical protein